MLPAEFLPKALEAAKAAGSIFPGYQVCEAALESGWGGSELALKCHNLFGQKEGFTSNEWPIATLPTHEYDHGVLVDATAEWPIFPDWETSFRERMELLRAKSCYAPALAAPDGETFVRLVSRHWATDPQRADKVLAIYRRHQDLLEGPFAADLDGSICNLS